MDKDTKAKRFLTPAELKKRQKVRHKLLERQASSPGSPSGSSQGNPAEDASRSNQSGGSLRRTPSVTRYSAQSNHRYQPYVATHGQSRPSGASSGTRRNVLINRAVSVHPLTVSSSGNTSTTSLATTTTSNPNPDTNAIPDQSNVFSMMKEQSITDNPFDSVSAALGITSASDTSTTTCMAPMTQPVEKPPSLPQLLSNRAFSVPVSLSSHVLTSSSTFKVASAQRNNVEQTSEHSQTTNDLDHIDSRHFGDHDESDASLSDIDEHSQPYLTSGRLFHGRSNEGYLPNSSSQPLSTESTEWVDTTTELVEDPSLYRLLSDEEDTPGENETVDLNDTSENTLEMSTTSSQSRLMQIFRTPSNSSALSSQQVNHLQKQWGLHPSSRPTGEARKEAKVSSPKFSDQLPFDWMLRTGVIFQSSASFEWAEPARLAEHLPASIQRFAQRSHLPITTPDRLDSTVGSSNTLIQFLSCLHHWRYETTAHTELYANLLSRILNQSKKPSTDEQRELDRLHLEAERTKVALRAAHRGLQQASRSNYFYYGNSEFYVLFIRIRRENKFVQEARIAPSTIGLRKSLTQYHIPFTVSTQESVSHSRGESLRSDSKDTATSTPDLPKSNNGMSRKHDNTARSWVYVQGDEACHNLCRFLSEWQDPRQERRLRQSVQVLAPFPFLQATLQSASVKAVRRVRQTTAGHTHKDRFYTLEIHGFILPTHWVLLLQSLALSQRGEFSAVLTKEAYNARWNWLNQSPTPSLDPSLPLLGVEESEVAGSPQKTLKEIRDTLVYKVLCKNNQFAVECQDFGK
ncbi:hypothetical protein IWQ62_001848 [Dispira parvispora]|uniref:Uncharacterized protein n=1 Tax=Dispira parvispora TaxID=1520584 RepID=A0A9W8ARN1_9FUNG|nr:hypothetical protein IWQ62_001848 [Dispira parvispora]